MHWRDPTLKEVIEFLDSNDKVQQLNASGYLQHLTYNDNIIKEETRFVYLSLKIFGYYLRLASEKREWSFLVSCFELHRITYFGFCS